MATMYNFREGRRDVVEIMMDRRVVRVMVDDFVKGEKIFKDLDGHPYHLTDIDIKHIKHIVNPHSCR